MYICMYVRRQLNTLYTNDFK